MEQGVYTLSIDGVRQATGNKTLIFKNLGEHIYPENVAWRGQKHNYTIAEVVTDEDGTRDDKVAEKGAYVVGQGIIYEDIQTAEDSTKYIKLPLEVEAFKYTGFNTKREMNEYPDWFTREFYTTHNITHDEETDFLNIRVPEGTYEVHPGDYVIRNVKGNILSRTGDNFEESYVLSVEYTQIVYEELGVHDNIKDIFDQLKKDIDSTNKKRNKHVVAEITSVIQKEEKTSRVIRYSLIGLLIVISILVALYLS